MRLISRTGRAPINPELTLKKGAKRIGASNKHKRFNEYIVGLDIGTRIRTRNISTQFQMLHQEVGYKMRVLNGTLLKKVSVGVWERI
jgi:hypothetical protein